MNGSQRSPAVPDPRRYVTLGAGFAVVPLPAFCLAWELEARGLELGVDGEYLTIGPCDLITEEDRARCRRWKPQLLTLIAHDGAIGGVQ